MRSCRVVQQHVLALGVGSAIDGAKGALVAQDEVKVVPGSDPKGSEIRASMSTHIFI